MKTLVMAEAVDILVTVLVGLGLLLLSLSAASDCWRQDAKDPTSSVGLSIRCRGLWSECLFDNVANLWTCDIPVSYLSEHPAVLMATRVLVVLSGFLTLSAIPPFIAGMRCIKLLQNQVHQKHRLTLAAGVLFLLGGLSGATAILWYGLDTVQKYKLEVCFTSKEEEVFFRNRMCRKLCRCFREHFMQTCSSNSGNA
uniref:Claudin n=1 Tax=Salvator merianae TaxID=96440 RepID=A0A8D0BUJ5_SALMN